MRTCLLLSGKSDSFDKYTMYYENTIKKWFNPDVFISTWEHDKVDDYISYYKPNGVSITDLNGSEMKYRINDIKDYLEKIQYTFDRSNIINSLYPMFYNIYRCGLIKKEYELINGFKYDLVFHSRPDLLYGNIHTSCRIEPFLSYIPDEEIKDSLINSIYLRLDPYVDCDTNRNMKIDNWIGDSFSFGNSDLMDKYTKTFLNIKEILKNGQWDNNINEKMLFYSLKKYNINIKHTYFCYSIKW